MRYIFISDVHGEYDKMMAALDAVHYDNKKDTLVTVGDLFDRGLQSLEVLNFILAQPRAICLRGNHEDRLEELLLGAHPQYYDNSNGVRETLQSFCGLKKLPSIFWGLQVLRSDHKEVYKKLWQYLDRCIDAFEVDNLIATHAWLPTENRNGRLVLREDWRDIDDRDIWNEARWTEVDKAMAARCYPDKDLIIGHWHAWRLAAKFGGKDVGLNCPEKLPQIDCSTYTHYCDLDFKHKIICIDGCSNYPYGGCVNTYVYNTDDTGIFYSTR